MFDRLPLGRSAPRPLPHDPIPLPVDGASPVAAGVDRPGFGQRMATAGHAVLGVLAAHPANRAVAFHSASSVSRDHDAALRDGGIALALLRLDNISLAHGALRLDLDRDQFAAPKVVGVLDHFQVSVAGRVRDKALTALAGPLD